MFTSTTRARIDALKNTLEFYRPLSNHFEYDTNTLQNEYVRDTNSGMVIDIPKNYFPDNDPNKAPINCWEKDGAIFFNNWLNNF